MRKPRESDLIRPCLDLLNLLGILAWRNNSGAVVAGTGAHRRFIRYGLVGSSDILGVLPPSGRMLAVELKQKSGRLTEHQRHFLDTVSAAGGVALVVRSVEELQAALRAEGIG